MRIFLVIGVLLILILAGCEGADPTPEAGSSSISQERALEIAGASVSDSSQVAMSAKLEEQQEIKSNNVKESPIHRPITPLEIRFEESSDGFAFHLVKENVTLTTEVQSIASPYGGNRVIHLVRRLTQMPEGQRYRMDVIAVDSKEKSFQVIPFADVLVIDSYSIDSLTRVYGFLDPAHAIMLQPEEGADVGGLKYDLVSLNVQTGTITKLMEGALPNLATDFRAVSWIHARSNKLYLNSFSGGTMWSIDWSAAKSTKWEASFKNSWPLISLFHSPDGERFWFVDSSGSRLHDRDGELLTILPPHQGLRVYPPFQWSPDSRYAASEYTRDESQDYILSGEEGIYDLATTDIRIYDRKGQVVWETNIPQTSPNAYIEWCGWLAEEGRGLLRRYELERKEGQKQRKVRSVYSVLDIATGRQVKLTEADRLEELKHPEAVKLMDDWGRLLVVDPGNARYYWIGKAEEPGTYQTLLSGPGEKPFVWSESNYRANETAVHRFNPDTGQTTTIRWNEARGQELQLYGEDLVFDPGLQYRYIR